jgi:hypothetical protein
MSLRDRIQANNASSGTVALILGERLSGKTTIAGTLEGRTLLLSAKLRESGAGSAEVLAKQSGHELDVVLFDDYDDLRELLEEAAEAKYDNLFIDSISAISEQLEASADFRRACGPKKNIFDGFRWLGNQIESLIMRTKQLGADSGINIFMTMALRRKESDGTTTIMPVVKGNIALEALKKMLGVLVSVYLDPETGKRSLLTRSRGPYSGRIDSILDSGNHGVIEPNLTVLLECIKQGSVNPPILTEEVSNG